MSLASFFKRFVPAAYSDSLSAQKTLKLRTPLWAPVGACAPIFHSLDASLPTQSRDFQTHPETFRRICVQLSHRPMNHPPEGMVLCHQSCGGPSLCQTPVKRPRLHLLSCHPCGNSDQKIHPFLPLSPPAWGPSEEHHPHP